MPMFWMSAAGFGIFVNQKSPGMDRHRRRAKPQSWWWSTGSVLVLVISILVLYQFFLVSHREIGVGDGMALGTSRVSLPVRDNGAKTSSAPPKSHMTTHGTGGRAGVVTVTPRHEGREQRELPRTSVHGAASGIGTGGGKGGDASHVGVVLRYKGTKNFGNPFKVDLRVYMNDAWNPERPTRELKGSEQAMQTPVGAWTGPPTFLHTQRRLMQHPWNHVHSGNATVNVGGSQLLLSKDVPMEAAMAYIQGQPECQDKPVFMTMASVGHELYWQLVENFVYTMAKFNMSDCSIVVCMSDPNCMKACSDWNFPCYDWTFEKHYPGVERPSMMEQIAILKLRHLPKALAKGIDVFMLDLDVGFLASPQPFIDVFNDPVNRKIDIFVQEDMIFIMNRTKIGWKTWYTEPLPNIGLFLVRGNRRTASIFNRAWDQYDKYATAHARTQPGKDQNHVLGAMREKRATREIKYAYFANNTALLLDKIYTWQHNRSVELGGTAAENILHGQKAVAVHTTCYENTVKLWALKAANAYWNPRYYDPMRPTLSKLIYYTDEEGVTDELRALLWLGIQTGRSIIMGNIIGPPQRPEHVTDTGYDSNDPALVWPPSKIPPGVRASHYIRPGEFMKFFMHGVAPMWPGFRTLKLNDRVDLKKLGVELLEHSFYWRVQRNYADVPPVTVVSVVEGTLLQDIKARILKVSANGAAPRVVLHVCPKSLQGGLNECSQQARLVQQWANCSIGLMIESPTKAAWNRFRYAKLPNLKTLQGSDVNQLQRDLNGGARACKNIFGPLGGNRTCFGKCR